MFPDRAPERSLPSTLQPRLSRILIFGIRIIPSSYPITLSLFLSLTLDRPKRMTTAAA
jgi:hypothetical protein